MQGVFVWTSDGLVEIASAHDRADADRTRDDLDGRSWVPGRPFVAPTTERAPGGAA